MKNKEILNKQFGGNLLYKYTRIISPSEYLILQLDRPGIAGRPNYFTVVESSIRNFPVGYRDTVVLEGGDVWLIEAL